jgi:hypothetical protein
MMLIFAESEIPAAVVWVVSIIATALGSGGIATLGAKFYWDWKRNKREEEEKRQKANRDAIAEEEKLEREARKEGMAVDAEALLKVMHEMEENYKKSVAELRDDNGSLRKALDQVRSSTLQKILAAAEEHHECEKKYAALEVRFALATEKREELEARVKALEARP